MDQYLLGIDQGTTSSRAIIFSHQGKPLSQHQIDLTSFYPHDGWVEQNPEEMWINTLLCCQEALKKINLSPKNVATLGITNQRETTIIWDRQSGKPIYPAIVWQDRRTHEFCKHISESIDTSQWQQKTGLLLDSYFSATKIMWILENVPMARNRAERNELAFGTIDTFLLWRLTKGKIHATDATNASRTLLFNIVTQEWDEDILAKLNIPHSLLPVVLDSSAHFGEVDPEFFGTRIPIGSMIGDQQAATVGQVCFKPGMVKSTYGTGCFMLLNTGNRLIQSQNKLLSTVAYRLKNQTTYGLEGSIFSAGFIVKWLRDTLKIIKTAAETEEIAKSIQDTKGVYLVPAFTGLGAPYWDPHARAAILGLTPSSGTAQIVRAALEAVGYQTKDLLEIMQKESETEINTLRVDGGMAENNWLLQFLADILNLTIQRPQFIETTALGAAFLAGLQVGIYRSLDEIEKLWKTNQTFHPDITISQRDELYSKWHQAVSAVSHTLF